MAGSSRHSATSFVTSAKSRVRLPRQLAPTAAPNLHAQQREMATSYTTNASRRRRIRGSGDVGEKDGVGRERGVMGESMLFTNPSITIFFYGV